MVKKEFQTTVGEWGGTLSARIPSETVKNKFLSKGDKLVWVDNGKSDEVLIKIKRKYLFRTDDRHGI